MADKAALTAGPSGEGLAIVPLNDAGFFVDAAFSLFGDGGETIAARLAAAIEDDLFVFVAARTLTAFAEATGEETTAPLAAMHGSAAPAEDTRFEMVAGLPPAPPVAWPTESTAQSPSPVSDAWSYVGLVGESQGAAPDSSGAASLVGLSALAAQPASGMEAAADGTDAGSAAANGTFDIEIVYSGNPAYQTYFDQAAARWEQIIVADIPDFAGVDDLLINASIVNIDGAGGILGQAGWDAKRPGSTGLPYLGSMEFDGADAQSLVNGGGFLSVVLHEMGHILGIGTLWSSFGFLIGAGGSNRVISAPMG